MARARGKRKAKHDSRKRLRATMRGAKLIFNGNETNQLEYRQSNGLPMTREMLDVATGWAWRWKLTLSLICKVNGSLQRVPADEIVIKQVCCINELTDFVKEHHEIMALEQPAAWTVISQPWEVEILG